jgi:catechol 2,3-dioxygenase-like lactoylglutathione lyase family enzyme
MSEHRANVRFDHTIIPARDKRRSAEFFTRIFGLDEPTEAGFFLQVRLSDGRLLDFAEPGVDFPGHHYAFLVDDETFDAIMGRIRRDGVVHWADPRQRLSGHQHQSRRARRLLR